jgi:hypothetical protein
MFFGMVLVGCTAEVSVVLADLSDSAPASELDAVSLTVPIHAVEILRRADDDEWVALSTGPDPYNPLDFSGTDTTLDLLALRDGPVTVASDEVAAGTFAALRIRLTPADQPTLVLADNSTYAVEVPPGTGDALTVASAVTLAAGQEREFLLDIDARASVRRTLDGTYMLVPVLDFAGAPLQ